MAEIKRTFESGRMNKDLDERIVPQGEYRDALNIEVRTSDESDIGAVQNLYGNSDKKTFEDLNIFDLLQQNLVTKGVSGISRSNDSLISKTSNSYTSEVDPEVDFIQSVTFEASDDTQQYLNQVVNVTASTPYKIKVKAEVVLGNSANDGESFFRVSYGDSPNPYYSGSDFTKTFSKVGSYSGLRTYEFMYTATETGKMNLHFTLKTGGAYKIKIHELRVIPIINNGYDGGYERISSLDYPVVFKRNFNHDKPGVTLDQNSIKVVPYTTEDEGVSADRGVTARKSTDRIIQTGASYRISFDWVKTSGIIKYFNTRDPNFNSQPGYWIGETENGSGTVDQIVVAPSTSSFWKIHFDKNTDCVISNVSIKQIDPNPDITTKHSFVGSIADNKTNKAYFFLASPPPTNNEAYDHYHPASKITNRNIYRDMIVSYDNNTGNVRPIFVDIFRLDFLKDDVNAGNGSDTVEFDKIPCENDVAHQLIWRTNMKIKAVGENSQNILTNSDDDGYVNITHITIDGAQHYIHFDRFVLGDLTKCHAWIFKADKVLNFSRNNLDERKLITGINIIDDLLFWTDNNSEPKRVNVKHLEAFASATPPAVFVQHHTPFFIKTDSNYTDFDSLYPYEEEHITVIRKAPKNPLSLRMSSSQDGNNQDTVGYIEFLDEVGTDFFDINGELKQVGDEIIFQVMSMDAVGEGDILLLNCTNADLDEPVSASVSIANVGEDSTYKASITSLSSEINSSHTNWNATLEQRKPLFELKLGRFSYRYKYINNEYSTFAPWSELAFLPGGFDYIPKKGYNLGMVNNLRSLNVQNFVSEDDQMPNDVISVDILYKDTVSPNVYIVKTVKRGEAEWKPSANKGFGGSVKITSEMIHRTLPSSQLLRSWDNVPRLAKAQEVTGNRILYGNYLQNYNLKSPLVSQKADCVYHDSSLQPYKSIKSLRSYKVGVVFGDKYGRETPVVGIGGLTQGKSGGLNSEAGKKIIADSIYIDKVNATKVNSIKARLDWTGTDIEPWMDYYKFYIKETSSEYYNLVMDRWYNAQDGNIWVSFQSSDRNKVDEETYLILKKAHGGNTPVSQEARYKILAIENEAPDFIKTTSKIFGSQFLSDDDGNNLADIETSMVVNLNSQSFISLFGDPNIGAVSTSTAFKGIGYARIKSIKSGLGTKFSKWVKIASISATGGGGQVSVIEPFGDSADMDGLFGGAPDSYSIEIKDDVVENRPEFDGKFFVKILKDSVLTTNVLLSSGEGTIYNTQAYYQVNYIANTGINPSSTTTLYKGDYTTVDYSETPPTTIAAASTNHTSYEFDHSIYQSDQQVEEMGSTHNFDNDGLDLEIGDYGYGHYTKNFKFWEDYVAGYQQVSGKDTYWFIDGAPYWKAAPGANAWTAGFIDQEGIFNIADGSIDTTTITNPLTDSTFDLAFGATVYHNTMRFSIITGSSSNYVYPAEILNFYNDLSAGTIFRFPADPLKTKYVVTSKTGMEWLGYNYKKINEWPMEPDDEDEFYTFGGVTGRRSFEISFSRLDDGIAGVNLSVWDPRSAVKHDGRSRLNIEILQENYDIPQSIETLADNGIWETEPKDSVDLDLYYEATGAIPIELREDNNESFVPVGAEISCNISSGVNNAYIGDGVEVGGIKKDIISTKGIVGNMPQTQLKPFKLKIGDVLKFKHSNGMVTQSRVEEYWSKYTKAGDSYKKSNSFTKDVNYFIGYNTPEDFENQTDESVSYGTFTVSNTDDILSWFKTDDNQIFEIKELSTSNCRGFIDEIYHKISTTTQVVFTLKKTSPTTTSENYEKVSLEDLGIDSNLQSGTIELNINEVTGYYKISSTTHDSEVLLPWFNCYSFGNGLESDRIRDDFNAPQIDNGVKVSTGFDDYSEERRGSGMIYSGIYNSTSSVNELNQFNMSQSVTKDLNNMYGSIQALKTRDTNVVAFCEDKLFKILANKDALFNADGDVNVTSSNAVLGDASSFVGEYGISSNPESLTVDGRRMYFADKQRNKVLRLSQDGLTVISNNGMSSWFRDNLSKTKDIIGTFDIVKGEYNLSLTYSRGLLAGDDYTNKTLSFNESSRGWSSFKSFIPETGVSLNDEYITCQNSNIWGHHDKDALANNFYGTQYTSTIDVMFNDAPGSVKSFNYINYEGTASKVDEFESINTFDSFGNQLLNVRDGEYYNLSESDGWYVESFNTDLQEGSVDEFIEKEGKWFNSIRGVETTLSNLDTSEFTVQGIGVGTYPAPVESGGDGVTGADIEEVNLTIQEQEIG